MCVPVSYIIPVVPVPVPVHTVPVTVPVQHYRTRVVPGIGFFFSFSNSLSSFVVPGSAHRNPTVLLSMNVLCVLVPVHTFMYVCMWYICTCMQCMYVYSTYMNVYQINYSPDNAE